MRMLNRTGAEALLAGQGVPDSEIARVMTGFDIGKPMYEHPFWPQDVPYQLVRRPTASDPSPAAGNWFGLAGMTSAGVAINDGLGGRGLVAFAVLAPFTALEGTAARFALDRGKGIGGAGGATQVYVPRNLLGHLRAIGPAERW